MRKEKTFSIGRVCTATGLSRTGVIKLEQEGLLFPSRQGASGKRRVYSIGDVERIFRIRSMQHCGFSHAEVRKLLGETNDYASMIRMLEDRKREMERVLRCLSMMSGREQVIQAEEIEVPPVCTYVCQYRTKAFDPENSDLMERTLTEAVRAGARVDYFTPWHYRLATRDVLNAVSVGPVEFSCCIPVKEPIEDEHIVQGKGVHALMICLKGTMEHAAPYLDCLRETLRQKRYLPAEKCAVIPLVNAMTDPGLREEDRVIEILIPVEPAEENE